MKQLGADGPNTHLIWLDPRGLHVGQHLQPALHIQAVLHGREWGTGWDMQVA